VSTIKENHDQNKHKLVNKIDEKDKLINFLEQRVGFMEKLVVENQ